jgi:pimeloyl-ACP methyl ester carboxylesterase
MTTFFQSTHGKIAYTDNQTGSEILILMHGLPTAKEIFSPVIPHLNLAYRLISFDLNDYGQSEKIGRHISHQARADVLDELRQHLHIEAFNLIAHDLGASVAVDYMGQYAKHVKKLVLLSPPVYPDFKEPFLVKLVRIPWLGETLLWLAGSLILNIGIKRGMVHKNRFTPELQQAIGGPFLGPTGRAALLRILRWGRPHLVFKDYVQIIKSIAVPTLVIQGRHDPYIPDNQVLRLENDIQESKLVFIEDGGHFLPMDTPKQVAREINAFIG